MENKELTDRLEFILECLVGSCTSNLTGEDQLDDLITELKAKQNEDLGNVIGYYYLKDGDLLRDGDEYYENDFDNMWITVTDPSESDVFNSNTYYKTRRKT
tara:strand:+ start:28 stop:330 length:303 start_codon:yes stop_codon:yes gene_type:complete